MSIQARSDYQESTKLTGKKIIASGFPANFLDRRRDKFENEFLQAKTNSLIVCKHRLHRGKRAKDLAPDKVVCLALEAFDK